MRKGARHRRYAKRCNERGLYIPVHGQFLYGVEGARKLGPAPLTIKAERLATTCGIAPTRMHVLDLVYADLRPRQKTRSSPRSDRSTQSEDDRHRQQHLDETVTSSPRVAEPLGSDTKSS